MKKMNCPFCNKELIRLEPFEDGIFDFWCDNCNVDISVTKNQDYICDCCGKYTDIADIVFHSDYTIGICNDCYNKLEDENFDLWYACQDCNFCSADMIHNMLKELKKT